MVKAPVSVYIMVNGVGKLQLVNVSDCLLVLLSEHNSILSLAARCPELDDPAYGSVDDGDNSVGTKAVYTCNKGFKLNGDSTRKCQENCEWSGKPPTCERKHIAVTK